jgi:pseudouridine-5'-phosphate glycosidase
LVAVVEEIVDLDGTITKVDTKEATLVEGETKKLPAGFLPKERVAMVTTASFRMILQVEVETRVASGVLPLVHLVVPEDDHMKMYGFSMVFSLS